jgi:single-strand DNA-binding protein
VAWRNNAEFIARYFHKGSSICVVGNIQTRTWTDQQNAKRYATEVVVDEVFFVDSKAGGGAQQAGAPAAVVPPGGMMAAPNFEVIEGDDEIPF